MTDLEIMIIPIIPIISIITCMFFSYQICNFRSYQYPRTKNNRLGNIDGLRGYLALGVFMHHYAITFHWKNDGIWTRPPEDYFNHFGQTGVAIFFMITGFLFIRKILDMKGKIDCKTIYIGRIFRIAPLYLAAVVTIFIFVLIKSDFTINVSAGQLLFDFLRYFLYAGATFNDFSDTGKIIAHVDWTLKYEWLFYFSLPIVFLIMKSKLMVITLCLLSVAGALISTQITILAWGFNSVYLILFVAGGLTAKLSKYNTSKNIDHPLVSILALLGLAGVFWGFKTSFGFFQSILLALFFIPVALGNSFFGLLKKDFSIFLGEISYSIYLMHGIVLYFLFSTVFPEFAGSVPEIFYMLFMPGVILLVTLLSWITYSYIEQPMISIGRNIANKSNAPSHRIVDTLTDLAKENTEDVIRNGR